MKNVTFTKLTIVNFLSIGKEPVVIDIDKGINIITGQNLDKNQDGNGVGKSTVVDAFFFALFGETLRELKKEEIVNKINKKGCKVILDFSIDKNGTVTKYRIVRGLAPSNCLLYIDGVDQDKTLSTIPVTNTFILNLINSTKTVFRNTITMRLNNSVPFMNQRKNEKRDFIEGLLRLELFKIMNKIAGEQHSEMFKDYDFTIKASEENLKNIEIYKVKEASYEESRKNQVQTLQNRIQQYEQSLVELQKSFVPVNEDGYQKCLEAEKTESEQLKTCESTYSKYNREVAANESQTNEAKKRIQTLVNSITLWRTEYDKYPKFEGGTKDIEECKTLIQQYTSEIENLRKLSVNLERDVSDLHKTIRTIKETGSFCDKCKRPYPENDLKANEEKITNCKQDIDAKDQQYITSQLTIADLQVKIKKLEIIIKIMDLAKEKKSLELDNTTRETELGNLKTRLFETEQLRETHKGQFQKIQDEKQVLALAIQKNQHTRSLIDNTQYNMAVTRVDIEKVQNAINDFASLIKTAEQKKAEYAKAIEEYKEKVAIYDVIKFVVSDEGVKSFIVKKLLNILNERINYYLAKLDANCTLTFDEYFDDKIINDKGQECSYQNFSDGERKRIDLSALFSFMDLRRIQGDVSFNVAFYDELLDSALSVSGSEKVFEILKERSDKYQESAYIVTHRKENLKNQLINKIIQLEKMGGITRMAK